MSKKMLINTDHPEECRVVIVENGNLEEFIVEHSTRERLKGNVYQGVITRVEPAIEAAFVDFGGKKFGFLPFKDVRKESYLQTREKKAKVRIQDVLIRGQKIIVQVVKEERDAKGPTITNFLTIPGRFLVLMTGNPSGGVSRKIEDELERKKLKEIVSGFDLPEDMGVIIRTAGMGRTKAELQKDFQMLIKIWETIQNQSTSSNEAPSTVYQVPDMVVRTVRDHYTADTEEILVDNQATYKTLRSFFKLVMPRIQSRVKLHQDTIPLFTAYKIEDQIESIYKRRVELPSGGSLVFDSGEALAAIDVNSGKTTSASELEETALKTNLEAADEVGRQLRLRDLGGLIVIDFIDMFQKKNKSLIEKQVKQACKKDKARINISRISKFGLLEMSRQRLSPPVEEGSFDQCHNCEGTGIVKSQSAISLAVLRKIQEIISKEAVKKLGVEISAEIVSYLLNNKMGYLTELKEKHDLTIEFQSKENVSFEDFVFNVLEKSEDKPVDSKYRESKTSEIVKPDKKMEIKSGDSSETASDKDGTRKKRGVRKKYTRRSQGRKPGPRGRRRVSPKSETESSENQPAVAESESSKNEQVDVVEVIPKTEESISPPAEVSSSLQENPAFVNPSTKPPVFVEGTLPKVPTPDSPLEDSQ